MKDEFKEICKILNSSGILACWLCNYLLMFYIPPLAILLTEIGIFIIINILLFIIWMVID